MSNKTVSGNLFVIAAPSGAGKTSLVKALSESIEQLKISISHTTRPIRPGEVDGQDYFFIDDSAFSQMAQEDAFLEHATVYDNQYGTSREWVQQHLSRGIDVILEIDWQGANQVRAQFPAAVLIFIAPPSLEALVDRLKRREQDDTATIARRMAIAQDEASHYGEFDYLVVNDCFDEALADLQCIVSASRLTTRVQSQKQAPLLARLLHKGRVSGNR